MADFVHLNREDKVGLGLAVAAHVALAVALVVAANKSPANVPIPERMTVSLADEVSLESTAPDPSAEPQAAVAPVIAPEPAPVVEPERPVERTITAPPEPRPTVAPRPQPTQTPKPRATQEPKREEPKPKPSPSPTKASTGGGSRLGSDFLEGSSSGERSESRGTPAATFGAAEAASLNSAISRQIRPHWSAPQGVDTELLVTIVRFRLNRDGTLDGRPTCTRQSGVTDSNEPQKGLHCERAIRAVQLAAPFDLPGEFYDKWKLVNSTFDRRL